MKKIFKFILSHYVLLEKPFLNLHKILSWNFNKIEIENNNVFHIKRPDYLQSSITGMTRETWSDAATYLLKGAFNYINSKKSLMLFPKEPGKSYPRYPWTINANVYLEGLCRSLFLAAPLLKNQPNLILNEIEVASYYREQLQQLVATESKLFISPRGDNDGPMQQLVELGTLSISLTQIPEILWHPLSCKVKDEIKDLMLSYAEGPTVPNNWRFFNIFILSFLKRQGYKVNDLLLEKYLNEALSDYTGQGWYHDNPAYDYYSMWGFQTHSAI